MIKAYAKSDIGKVREINQDDYYISESLDEVQLYMLADGMGGYNGGEIASKFATLSAKSYIETNFETIPHDRDNILKLIASSIEYANMVVYEKAKENLELANMGTTLEICLIYNSKAFIGHIGDSRIYRIRKEFIRKLTKDHSYVEELVKDGTITKEEAEHHPKKNMLMKAVGCTPYVEPDVMVKGFIKEDVLLMCSDGLTNMVTEQEIYEYVKKDVQTSCEQLIKRANEMGGYDNITVVILQND